MLVRRRVADNVGPVAVKDLHDTLPVAHGADEHDEVQLRVRAPQLHLDVVGVVLIDIENDETPRPLRRRLPAELTADAAAGEESIRRMAEQVPDILVGAGTVLNIDQCERALAAGAKYIVSPGYNDELVDYCVKKGVPVLPGCVNASDITKAVNAGLRTVKFFPAEQSGGVKAIKALAPVFPVDFMPGVRRG